MVPATGLGHKEQCNLTPRELGVHAERSCSSRLYWQATYAQQEVMDPIQLELQSLRVWG